MAKVSIEDERRYAEHDAALSTQSAKAFLPPEADQVPRLVRRYQACALRIWKLFPGDPLPEGDPAHFWIERLESILDRDLLAVKETSTD